MVDKNVLRAAFSARLHEALDAAGVRKRGRGVDIQKQLKEMGVYKTTQAISKWLNGEAIPEADSLGAICTWVGVRREWMEYGVLPKTSSAPPTVGLDDQHHVHTLTHMQGKVPLISWEQASRWGKAGQDSASFGGVTWLSCPLPISRNGYALTVRGDSMTNPGPGKTYPPGCVIFVDPDAKACVGDRVIATVPNTNEATFKILVEDAGRQFLRSINPQYPIIEYTQGTSICGKVIGAFISD